MIKLLMMFMLTTNLWAATVWTEQVGERYYTYNTTPTKATQKLARVLVTSLDSVNPLWVKIGNEFIKEVSANGAIRYTPAPLPDQCVAQFICHAKWGWIVNVSQQTVNKCPAIKIKNEQIVMYDNAAHNQVDCPKYLK